MDGVGLGKLKIQAIKNILLVPSGMDDLKFRRIKKAAAVQSIDGNKISPLLASISEIKSSAGCAISDIRFNSKSYGSCFNFTFIVQDCIQTTKSYGRNYR